LARLLGAGRLIALARRSPGGNGDDGSRVDPVPFKAPLDMPPQIVVIFSAGWQPRHQSNFQIKGIIMSETIVINSDHREVKRGITKDSSVLCSATSAPDVYVHVIGGGDVAELFKGDGSVIPKMTSTRIHLFRKDPGDDPFSATVVITDLPGNAADKSNALMMAFSMVKHKPDAMKIKTAKKTAKKAAKKAVKKKAAKKKG
jgi:hypothetical protein